MKAPKYIDNSVFSFLENARKKKQHLDYLASLKKEKCFFDNMKDHIDVISKFQIKKVNTGINNYALRMQELGKKNKVIMNKIIDISNRNHKKKFNNGGNLPLGSFPTEKHTIKSLTLLKRKEDAQKVMLENISMANRILKTNASIPIRKFRREFTETEKYRNNTRKLTPASKLKFQKLETMVKNRSFTANNHSYIRDISNISKTEESRSKKHKIGSTLNTSNSSPKSRRP